MASTALAEYLALTLNGCREQCTTVVVLENSFRRATIDCIEAVKADKTVWKNGLMKSIKDVADKLPEKV